MKYKFLIIFILGIIFTSCKNQVSFSGSSSKSNFIFSGVVSPFLGLISESDNLFLSSATAVGCSGTPVAKLFKIESDGSINDSNPLATLILSSDARYSFDLKALGFNSKKNEVEFLVKASGCGSEVYKRPVTDFDSKQDLNAATTVVANLVNTDNLSSVKLNQVSREAIKNIISELPTSSTSLALTELQTNTTINNQFQTVFNSNPTVINNARPDVEFVSPGSSLNELATNTFRVNTFHVDPTYSFAYSWKLDGVVKSTSATYNYIPSSNESGLHQIDVYVGKDNGSGGIDTSYPYYTKAFSFSVNNNILPTAPNIALNASTPSPRSVNNILLDINTGSSLGNCASFSHLAISESNTPPGIMQFNIDCTSAGTQTESVTFSSSEGSKTIYLWAMDNEGTISAAKSVNVVLDSNPPLASVTISDSVIKGGITESVTYAASDLGVGLSDVKLYLTTNGSTYNLLSTLTNNGTSSSFTTPSVDTTSARLKIVATDLTGLSTTAYSNIFTIDSTNPVAPSFNLFSANPTSASVVQVTLNSCPADSAFILLTESNVQPTGIESGWASCSTSNGAFSISITGDGTHHLYVWTKDLAQNISLASTTNTVVLDTTAPVINSGPSIATSLNKGGATKTISWSVTDTTTTTINLLYSLDNGSTYNSIATGLTNNGSYSWTLPTADSSTVKLKLVANDALSFSSNNISSAFIIDSTAPTISLSTPTGPLKGGSIITLNYSVTDTNGVASMDLSYASDGVTFGAPTALTVGSTSSSWTVNSDNTSSAKLKITSTDAAGNSTTYTTSAFIIDSTAPTAPTLTLASTNITNNSTANLTIGSCTDTAFVLINETNSAPSAGDVNWVACTTVAGGIAHSLIGDGAHTLYAWAKDQAGNIASSANSVSVTLDTTNPTISLGPTIASIVGGGSVQAITWTATDATTLSIKLEYFDGNNWNTITNSTTNSGSYNWTVASLNINNAKIKITATDGAGNTATTTGSDFIIDSTPPTISSFTLASGATSVALPTVSVQISASDSLTSITQMRMSESATYANDNWQTYSANSGSFTMSMISGSKTVYLWLKDSVGNITTSTTSNINLDFGNPPTVSIVAPTSSSGPYNVGDNVHIEWSCGSTNGVDTNPARIKYTTDDGVTFTNITSWITNNLTSTSGSYEWALPAGVTVFRLLVECRSAAGVVSSSYSSPINTSGWSVFAGDPANMSENVSATLALMIKGSAGFQSMASDKDGHIYFVKNSVLMKIDSQTGLVTRFAGDPSNSSCNMQAGSDPLSSSYNRIGVPVLLGTNTQRDSIIFGVCSKVWIMNTTTRALSILNSSGSYVGYPWFFSKTGNLYYAQSGYLYKLNLNLAEQSPVVIAGNGTCQPTISAAGTDATSSAIPSDNANNCVGETYIVTNNDDSKIWIGCWNGVTGCQNSARLDYNLGLSKYQVGSNNVGWGFADWDKSWCVPSVKSNRVWCSSRYSTTFRTYFDTSSEVWTKTALGKTVFIRYVATNSGMVSLSSDNFLMNYAENADNSITVGQIGGSDIESYGNGSVYSSLAFGAVEDISFSSGLNSLFIDTSVKIRRIDFNATSASTTNFGPSYNTGYLNRMTVNQSGSKFTTIYNCSGNLYFSALFNGTSFTGNDVVKMSRNGCGNTTYDATYPLVDNSPVSTRTNWQIDFNRRPLNHTNGKFYFGAADSSGNNMIIYSSDGTTLRIIAGIPGTSGYVAGDSGNAANLATLKNVRAIFEVPSGKPNAGDLLIVDNNRLRLITITTESATPKIYDMVQFSLAAGYGSNNSDTFIDVVYDFNNELLNGSSQPVLGTGPFYYVTNTNIVRKFVVSSLSGSTPASATDTAYSFTGTTLSGTTRLALTPAGLLVTQPTKQRILRVAP